MNRYIANTLGLSLIVAVGFLCLFLGEGYELERDIHKEVSPTAKSLRDTLASGQTTMKVYSDMAPQIASAVGSFQEAATEITDTMRQQQDSIKELGTQSVEAMKKVNGLLVTAQQVMDAVKGHEAELSPEVIAAVKSLHDMLKKNVEVLEAARIILVNANKLVADEHIKDLIVEMDGMIKEGHATVGNLETISEQYADPHKSALTIGRALLDTLFKLKAIF